jgi:hypothetical protein
METKQTSKKLHNNKTSAKLRRQTVIVFLENQLSKKTKQNDGVVTPLKEEDITRINKELTILKSRI